MSYRYDTIDEDYGPDSPPVHSPGGIKGTTSPRSVFASSGIDKKPAEPNVDFEFDFKVWTLYTMIKEIYYVLL